jgi:hypothetical protein
MDEPPDIPLQGLRKGEKHMGEGGDHGMLMMSETRHNRIQVLMGLFQKSRDQPIQFLDEIENLPSHVQPHIQRYLVIAAPGRMELPGRFHPIPLDEKTLHVAVDILPGSVQDESPSEGKAFDLPEASQNHPEVVLGNNPLPTEHDSMRFASPDRSGADQREIPPRHPFPTGIQ